MNKAVETITGSSPAEMQAMAAELERHYEQGEFAAIHERFKPVWDAMSADGKLLKASAEFQAEFFATVPWHGVALEAPAELDFSDPQERRKVRRVLLQELQKYDANIRPYMYTVEGWNVQLSDGRSMILFYAVEAA